MKVSIITICYNNQDTIRDTIKSVLCQDYEDIEYILVDGQSSDDTLKIIEELQQPYFKVKSEKDNGIYDALNKGIAMATGDVVGMIHADDLYAATDVVSNVVKIMGEDESDALYGDLLYVNRDDTKKVIRNWKSGAYKKNSFLWGWMPPHPTFFVKRQKYEEFGVFNTKLKSAADYELMLRFIHKNGIKLSYLPQILVKMRVGGQSNASLSNRLKANNEDQLAWELNDEKPYWFTRYLKPLRKISQYIFK